MEQSNCDADNGLGHAKRIHITGAPRSGTTLLLALMLSCFEIDGGVLQERRLWRTPPKKRRIVCSKYPDETDFAVRMLPLDPDLHVVFLLRDPRDVVVSRSHIAPTRYLTNLRVWKDNLAAARPWFGHKRFHVVDYSELTSDPDRVQLRLLRDMPFLRPKRPFTRFQECASEQDGGWLKRMHMKLRPVSSDSTGSWRGHLSRLKGQLLIHGHICEELIELGYERDGSWAATLAGVRPDLSHSDAIERPYFGKRVTRRWRNSLGEVLYLARRYLRLELSDTGEQRRGFDLPRRAANENLSFAGVPDEPRAAVHSPVAMNVAADSAGDRKNAIA